MILVLRGALVIEKRLLECGLQEIQGTKSQSEHSLVEKHLLGKERETLTGRFSE
jgi:hypothetical protein